MDNFPDNKQNNNDIDVKQVSPSTELSGSMQENIVREYDNTSLDTAVNEDKIKTPLNAAELTPNSRRGLYAILGAGTALVVSTVIVVKAFTGSATAENELPKSDSVTGEGVDSSEVAITPEVPAVITRLDGPSFEDFAKTPRDDQLTYANYLESTEYAGVYEEVYGTDEWYTSQTSASANNSDREIIDNLNHTIQIAQMTPKDHTFVGEDGSEYSQLYDSTQGKKVLSGAFTENIPETGYPGYLQESLDLREDGIFAAANVVAPQFGMKDSNFTGSNFECMDDITQTNEVCRSIDIVEANKTGSLRVILTPYKDAVTGLQEFKWLALDR